MALILCWQAVNPVQPHPLPAPPPLVVHHRSDPAHGLLRHLDVVHFSFAFVLLASRKKTTTWSVAEKLTMMWKTHKHGKQGMKKTSSFLHNVSFILPNVVIDVPFGRGGSK
jgi:hypothetical protein